MHIRLGIEQLVYYNLKLTLLSIRVFSTIVSQCLPAYMKPSASRDRSSNMQDSVQEPIVMDAIRLGVRDVVGTYTHALQSR